MQIRSSLAVVDDTHFYTGKSDTGRAVSIPHAQVDRIESLLADAAWNNFTHLWIVPGTELSRRCSVPAELDGWYERQMVMPAKKRIGYGSYIQRGKKYRDRIQVGFAEYAPWPWEISTPKELLATITYLENALGGLPLEWTPAHMALDVIRQKNESRWSWLAPLKIDLEKETPVPGFRYGRIGKTLANLRFKQKPGKFHIKIDGNSDFGAFMTGGRFGEGDPTWQDDAALYDGLKPGFWHVKCEKVNSIFDGVRLPSFEDWEWATTDLIQQLRAVGYHIDIFGGWCWEKYHQTLRSTVSNKEKTGLWDLRLIWRAIRGKSPAHENVYESISAILHTVHGKLADEDIAQKRLYRPDIWAMVVAGAVARMLYRIVKIYNQFGLLPTRIHVDALEYDVDDIHILDSILSSEKLGGFKLVREIEPVRS